MKIVKSLINPVVCSVQNLLTPCAKPESLSISHETHMLHVLTNNLIGLSELIESVNKFYHDRKDKIHKDAGGTCVFDKCFTNK